MYALKKITRFNVSGIGRIIATNDFTASFLNASHGPLDVEPNIVAEASTPRVLEDFDDGLLTLAGLLIPRKRPWLALQALNTAELRNFRLQVIGDGPLRGDLESYVRQERLESRVTFTGQLDRERAIEKLSVSRVLVHPSIREGSPWAVGEAAAVGVPSVVFARLSDNGSEICGGGSDLIQELVGGVQRAAARPRPTPSARWSADRLPGLLDRWWAKVLSA